MTPILSVTGMSVSFVGPEGPMRPLDRVNLRLDPGECLGVVGESGSGKSLAALAIMGLLPELRGLCTEGSILLDGEELIDAKPARLRELRGRKIAMVFQDSMSALNPTMRVGDQVAEVLQTHQGATHRQGLQKTQELFELVGIPTAS